MISFPRDLEWKTSSCHNNPPGAEGYNKDVFTHPNATCVGCFVVSSASPVSQAASCPVKAISCCNARGISTLFLHLERHDI